MKLLLKKILSYLPSKLPVGLTEFNKFVDDIIELSGQYADRTSMEFAIASMLIHAPSHLGALSKNYFVVRLRKSAANQVASQVFQTIKEQQAQKPVEATTTSPAESSNVKTDQKV
jgi:hypothetical protein